jgi:lipoprotein-anchoring transpeptidase ErfK/SrfK
MSTSDLSRQVSRPSLRRRLGGGRRVLATLSVAMLAAVLLGAAGAGLSVYRGEQGRLARARADRAAAASVVQAALARAQSDGITTAELHPVLAAEAALVSGRPMASRLGWFDNGEIGRLERQAAGLRALVGRIDAVQVAATHTEREHVATILAEMDGAIAAARSVGLDPADEAAFLASVRAGASAADTPAQVDAAVASVRQRTQDLEQRTEARRAAAAAAAAAQAALDASRTRAQAAMERADGLVAEAQRFPELQVQPWVDAITAQHPALAAATTQDAYDSVTAAVEPPANSIAALLAARSRAYAAMANARQVVQSAISAKVDPGEVPTQLDSLQARLDATGTAGGFVAIAGQAAALVAPLEARLTTATLGAGKVILISLADQRLTAYQDGAVVLTSLVTTGRPALPTPAGTFVVLRKSHPWLMHSDFPRSSPYWYPDSPVTYVLWFTNQGHGIHDAPWRGTYGPGTQAAGSHGCVNVPFAAMKVLFDWAEVGTRVVIR